MDQQALGVLVLISALILLFVAAVIMMLVEIVKDFFE